MGNRIVAVAVVLAMALVLAASATAAATLKGAEVPSDVAAAATTSANALAAGNTVAAWNLLSAGSRKEVEAPAWHRSFARRGPVSKPPATALLRALATSDQPPQVEEALLRPEEALVWLKGAVSITRSLALVREKEGWRVDLKASDELNSKQAAKEFLGAVREDAGITQPRGPRPTPEASLALLRVMLAPEAKDYRVQEAEVNGDRANVLLVAEVPVNLVLRANRSGAGWMVDLTRPVVPVDATAANPLQEAAEYVDKATCEEQLRQLVRGIQMYAASSDDMFPDPARWLEQIQPYLGAGFVGHCPRDTAAGFSYAFNANLKGKRLREVANPGLVPMVYESKLHTKNPADTGQSWAEPRHAGGNLVAFADSSVRPALTPLQFQVTTTSTPSGARGAIPRPPQPRGGVGGFAP